MSNSKFGDSILISFPDGNCPQLHVLRLVLDMLLGSENDLFIQYKMDKNTVKYETVRNDTNDDDNNFSSLNEWKFAVSYVGRNINLKQPNLRASGLTSMLKWFSDLGTMLLICRKYCSEIEYNLTNNDIHFIATLDFLKTIDIKLSKIYDDIIKENILNQSTDSADNSTTAGTSYNHTSSTQQLLFPPSQLLINNSSSTTMSSSSFQPSIVPSSSDINPSINSYITTNIKVKSILTLYQICRSWRQPAKAMCIWVKQNIVLNKSNLSNNIIIPPISITTTKEKVNNDDETAYSNKNKTINNNNDIYDNMNKSNKNNYTNQLHSSSLLLLEKLELQVKLANMTFHILPIKNAFFTFHCMSHSTRAVFIMVYTQLLQVHCQSLLTTFTKQNSIAITGTIIIYT